tara:strand:+ start:37758 stop:38003 length:246 start_codon:yes stop_codon:yes gene_type:complete
MAQGKVKWFNPKNGYGFITPDEGGSDIFVHASELKKAGITKVTIGEAVEYTVGDFKGKPVAQDITSHGAPADASAETSNVQ